MVSKDPGRMNNGVDGEKIASEMVLFFLRKNSISIPKTSEYRKDISDIG